MASLIQKKKGNRSYYYIVESARVNGKPRIVRQIYLGTPDNLLRKLQGTPSFIQHHRETEFQELNSVAAFWAQVEEFGLREWMREMSCFSK